MMTVVTLQSYYNEILILQQHSTYNVLNKYCKVPAIFHKTIYDQTTYFFGVTNLLRRAVMTYLQLSKIYCSRSMGYRVNLHRTISTQIWPKNTKRTITYFVNEQLRLTIKRPGFPQKTYIRVREAKIYRMQQSYSVTSVWI